jgi:hypothetical protein
MILKSSIFVLLMVLGVFAAPEILTKSSAPFAFKPGIGVIYQKGYTINGIGFSYKKAASGKPAMVFSWTLPKEKNIPGKLSIFSISGRLVKSFDLSSTQGSVNWVMRNGKAGSGVYFAKLSYGSFNKNLKIVF